MTLIKLKEMVESCGFDVLHYNEGKNWFYIGYPTVVGKSFSGRRVRLIYFINNQVYLDSWLFNVPSIEITGRSHLKGILENS